MAHPASPLPSLFYRLAIGAALLAAAACSNEQPVPPPLKLVKVFEVGGVQAASPGSAPRSASDASVQQTFRDPSALSFDAPGRVLAVLVKVGDTVSPGQALMRLDPRDLALSESSARTQWLAAQAELAAAEADFRRYSELYAKGFISSAEHQRRESQIAAARARFEAISDQLGYITLRSLAHGKVSLLGAKEGSVVNARQLMVRIALSSESISDVTQSPARASSVVRPGVDATKPQILRIPLSAVIEGGYVYRITQQSEQTAVLEKVAIKMGSVDEQSAEIISGLTRGDRIVAAGTHVLSPQERVRLR